MKNVSLLYIGVTMSLLLGLAGNSTAQGNLQFNQVKFYEFAVTQVGSVTCTESVQSITVPANKVWKIESATACYYAPSSNNSSLNTSQAGMICLNGKVIFQASATGNFPYFTQPILPLWLPPGTYNLSLRSSYTVNGAQFLGAVSIIEFNVVP